MKIPLFKTYWDEEDIEAVSRVIRRGTYWAVGPEIEEFEKRIASFIGTKYALTFNSGTSALHSLLLAYDVKDKEVIVPSFTFVATANAVLHAGGIPVFAESESDTFGLDAKDVRKKITDKTCAIIPIQYGGFPSRDTIELNELAKKHNLIIIDDAAESIGSHINDKKIGTYSDSAMFSFCQNKILATGEGGIIVTDNKEVYEKTKLLRSHGRVELAEDYFSSVKDNDYIQAGFNFRMPTMIAALGLSQFEKMNKIIRLRREKATKYTEAFSSIKDIEPPIEAPGSYSVYQMYTIKLPNKKIRDSLQEHLKAKGVMSKVYFNPIHLKTIYLRKGYKEGDLPKTERLSERVLNIPLYPTMTKEEQEYVIHSIQEYFKR